MNFNSYDWRNRRNINMMNGTLTPLNFSMSPYSTDQKSELKAAFGDDLFLNNLHLLPNLDKNLGDTVITEANIINSKMAMKTKAEEADKQKQDTTTGFRADFYSLSKIGSFISGVFNAISGGVFQQRPKSPASHYYDCFDPEFMEGHDGAYDWHEAKIHDENKTVRAHEHYTYSDGYNVKGSLEMNTDVSVVSHCEDKLKKVQLLLTNKSVAPPKFRRKPKRVFVQPNCVEENFEDAFATEDFVPLPSEEYVEYVGAVQNQNAELFTADAPKTKTDISVIEETMEIVKTIPDTETLMEPVVESVLNSSTSEKNIVTANNVDEDKGLGLKEEVISSCEDKLSKLKALLQDRKKNCLKISQSDFVKPPDEDPPYMTTTIKNVAATPKVKDKHFKNPNRTVNKRKKCNIRRNIEEDLKFANEIDGDDLSSTECSPKITEDMPSQLLCVPTNYHEEKPYFDEVSGRFRTASTTSEDSFQIVFTDEPSTARARMSSDCESEDSFIVFEDSPDSCYISQDVFGDEDCTDSESDHDSDDGFSTCKLSHSLSRTISDLTDDSLYDDSKCVDVVDCAFKCVCDEIPSDDITNNVDLSKSSGLLVDAAKKLLKKQQPPKKVSFSSEPPKVRVMRVWAFAAKQARRGDWERYALDRDRFKRRIADVEVAVSWVLKPQHRSRVMFQRIMPWRNAQRRKEIAERKEREAVEKKRLEEEAEKRRIEEEQKKLAEEEQKKIAEEEQKKLAEEEQKKLAEEQIIQEGGALEVKNTETGDENCLYNESNSQIIDHKVDLKQQETESKHPDLQCNQILTECNETSNPIKLHQYPNDLKISYNSDETQTNLKDLPTTNKKVDKLQESQGLLVISDLQCSQQEISGNLQTPNDVQGNLSTLAKAEDKQGKLNATVDSQEISKNIQETQSDLNEIKVNLELPQLDQQENKNSVNQQEKVGGKDPLNYVHDLQHKLDKVQDQHNVSKEEISIPPEVNKVNQRCATENVPSKQQTNMTQPKESVQTETITKEGKTPSHVDVCSNIIKVIVKEKQDVDSKVVANSCSKLEVDKNSKVNLNGHASKDIGVNSYKNKKPHGYFKKFQPKRSEVNIKIEKMNKMFENTTNVDKNATKLDNNKTKLSTDIDALFVKLHNLNIDDDNNKTGNKNGFVKIDNTKLVSDSRKPGMSLVNDHT